MRWKEMEAVKTEDLPLDENSIKKGEEGKKEEEKKEEESIWWCTEQGWTRKNLNLKAGLNPNCVSSSWCEI